MTYSLDQLKKSWNKYLEDGAFEQLFDAMKAHLNSESDRYSDYTKLRGRHSTNYNSEMSNTLSTADISIEKNRISASLLDLIKKLTPADLATGSASNAPGADPLDALAQQLEVHTSLSLLHLVNCDRREAVRSFNRSYGRWQEAQRAFQFYYILACPTQEPEGFSARIIYQLLHDNEERHQHSLNYRRHPDTGRVRIEDLPVSFTLKNCQEAFKKYFAERFGLGNTSFEEYLQTGLPRLQWEHVTTVMKISTQAWDPELIQNYLQWLMDCFVTINTHAPNFLFFFVISVKNAHHKEKVRRADREVLDTIGDLVASNTEHATLINALPPVEAAYFEDWLEDICQPDQQLKNKIIDTIAQKLSPEEMEQFQTEDKLLNMEHLQDFQKRVYKFHS